MAAKIDGQAVPTCQPYFFANPCLADVASAGKCEGIVFTSERFQQPEHSHDDELPDGAV